MKRIKAAAIFQTIHFQLKDGVSSPENIKAVQAEVQRYKDTLDRNRTKYRIEQEETQEDGSVIIRIRKQYNATPVGDYLD